MGLQYCHFLLAIQVKSLKESRVMAPNMGQHALLCIGGGHRRSKFSSKNPSFRELSHNHNLPTLFFPNNKPTLFHSQKRQRQFTPYDNLQIREESLIMGLHRENTTLTLNGNIH